MCTVRKEIRDLPKQQKIIIKSLSEYIKFFENGNYNNYIFRGEPENYKDIIASAFRGFNGCFNNYRKEYPFVGMINEFKKEVWFNLKPEKKENFIAFSQHHGIPTNLVDFSTSPLVALYFACECDNKNDLKNTDGFGVVNLFENKTIDITDILDEISDSDILVEYVNNNKIFIKLYRLFELYYDKYPDEFECCFKHLCDDIKNYHILEGRNTNEFENANSNYMKKTLILFDNNLPSEYKSIMNMISENNSDYSMYVLDYCFLLKEFIKYFVMSTDWCYWINCIPNFLYTPILAFERGRNQQGLFIYQAFLSYTDSVYGGPVLARQRIWPEILLIIENQKDILRELDYIGINRKFIYNDYDNISKYIKEKYNNLQNK